MEKKLVLTENTPIEEYENLYSKDEGFIFKVEGDYEAVMQRIKDHTPPMLDFEVYPINPGTAQFTLVGCGHCIVTKRVPKTK